MNYLIDYCYQMKWTSVVIKINPMVSMKYNPFILKNVFTFDGSVVKHPVCESTKLQKRDFQIHKYLLPGGFCNFKGGN